MFFVFKVLPRKDERSHLYEILIALTCPPGQRLSQEVLSLRVTLHVSRCHPPYGLFLTRLSAVLTHTFSDQLRTSPALAFAWSAS